MLALPPAALDEQPPQLDMRNSNVDGCSCMLNISTVSFKLHPLICALLFYSQTLSSATSFRTFIHGRSAASRSFNLCSRPEAEVLNILIRRLELKGAHYCGGLPPPEMRS